MKQYWIRTFGCQQNEADSERIKGMLSVMGYVPADDEKQADVAIINTCAVREHAEHRALGHIGELSHAKRQKPGQIVVVCGCMAQRPEMAELIQKSYRHVDLLIGPQELADFPALLQGALMGQKRLRTEGDERRAFDESLPVTRAAPPHAWVPIMAGCDNFCAYCIVPYVRGRERSRSRQAILAEMRTLIGQGYKEFTLLGQNVNSYGRGLPEEQSFSGLLREITALPGDFWVRFMTSHPKDASQELFDVMASSPKMARHLHLPFQSGSDRVLARMNRGYGRDAYLALIQKARRAMPDLVLTSDVIVGFPGEEQADFQDTLDLVEQVRFDALFTFLYSKRSGTPAAELPDSVTREVKLRRFKALTDLQERVSEEKGRAYVGKTMRVLVHEREDGALRARSSGDRLVRLPLGCAETGEFVTARITGANPWSLTGERVFD